MRRNIIMVAASALVLAASCGGGDESGSGSDFCGDWKALDERMEGFDSNLDFTDPAAVEEAFTMVVRAIGTVSEGAPEELRDDFAILNEAYGQLIDELDKVGYDFMAIAENEEIAALMDSSEVTAAQDAITEYGESVCGVVVDDTTPADEGSGGSDATTPAVDFSIPADGAVRDEVITMYQDMFGLDEEQATCLTDEILGAGADAEALADVGILMDLFSDCGIDLAALSGPGG